jgi:cytoskeletal protein CcmA (bactofilin family)
VIKGEITGREDLFIDGEVHGKICLDEGRVTVGPNGRVTADIEAHEIVIRGRVKGNLLGTERVEIRQTGHASGDVITQRILVEDGAELHGHVEITRGDRLPKNAPKNVPAINSVTSPAVTAKDSTKPVNVPSREPAAIA